MSYRIIFIDEQEDDIENFEEYVDEKNLQGDFEVVTSFPKKTLREMVRHIDDCNVDAVISDFKLNEYKTSIKYNVPYNGVELVKEIQKERIAFPCFVMTSFDDLATDESDDVNIVYIKAVLHQHFKKRGDKNSKANISEQEVQHVSFLERIAKQVNHYKKRIAQSEKRIIQLLKKQKKHKLTAVEEDELLELDSFVEKSIDSNSRVPIHLKRKEESRAMNELLSKVDELSKKLQNDSK